MHGTNSSTQKIESTLSPDEDLQRAVERRDQYQSDNRETSDKIKPFISQLVR